MDSVDRIEEETPLTVDSSLLSILDSIVGDKPAKKELKPPSLSSPITDAILAGPDDFIETCEHGMNQTIYMRSALFMLSNEWHKKYGVPVGECIFEKYSSFFLELDAKCRALHVRYPHLTTKEILKHYV